VTPPRPSCGQAPARLLVLALQGPADLATVDALARLRLAGKRVGLDIRLGRPDQALGELLTLTGLDGALVAGGSVVEVVGQAEAGEQPGVEEVVDVGDPTA
jgi:hypothetical protein